MMTDEDRQLLREKLTKQLMIETYMKHDTTKLNPVAVLWRLGAGGTSQLRSSGGMTDDEQRVEQIRMLFADAVERGDTDAQEILRAELLNSGILPIEEAIQLLDLSSCVVASGRRIRRADGASHRARVHPTRISAAEKQQRKSWA